MQTPEFTAGLDELLRDSPQEQTAIMCAEAVPWRCHRSLLGDYLSAQGIEVVDLVGGRQSPHRMTPVARIDDGRVSYPSLL
jgi:uncharacterized protein (DUF488 family)